MLTSAPERSFYKSPVVIVGGTAVAIVMAIIGISYYIRSTSQTAVPVPPTIKVFAATPAQVTKGSKVTIRWEVANADDVELEPFGRVPSSGSSIDEPEQTTIYKLKATNRSGGENGTFQEVIVNEPTPRTAGTTTPAKNNTSPADFVSLVKGTSPLTYFRLESRSGPSEVGNATYSFSGGVTNSTSGAPIGISQNYCAVLNRSNGKIDTTHAGGIAETGSMMIWFDLAALPSTEKHIFYLVGESEFRNDFDLQIDTDDTVKFYTGGTYNIAYRPDTGTLVSRNCRSPNL
jgi:hypothetical protein